MALTQERLAELKLYCRVDADNSAEDALLTRFYSGAVGYMENSGISEPPSGTPRRAQYDTCIDALVLDAYDHRGTAEQQISAVTDNPAFRRTLNQLKLTEPVSELDTGSGEGGAT